MRTTRNPPSGSGSLSQSDLFPPDSSTSEASSTSKPRTSLATTNATSSPGSADGAAHSKSQGSPAARESGPGAAPASPSARQDRAADSQTSATYGRSGSGSSASAALCLSLGNRLRARLLSFGSMEYALTWKERVTPSGRVILAQRASALPTSDRDSTGWPTASAGDSQRGETPMGRGETNPSLNSAAALVGWPTPCTPSGGRSVSVEKMDATGKTTDGRKHSASLEHAVKFSGWPTPRTPTGGAESTERKQELGRTESGAGDLQAAAQLAGWPTPMAGSPGTEDYNPAGNTDSSRKTVALVGWNTPRATGGSNGGPNQSGGALPHDAAMAGWARPIASEARQGFQDRSRGKKGTQESLTTQAIKHLPERERERETGCVAGARRAAGTGRTLLA